MPCLWRRRTISSRVRDRERRRAGGGQAQHGGAAVRGGCCLGKLGAQSLPDCDHEGVKSCPIAVSVPAASSARPAPLSFSTQYCRRAEGPDPSGMKRDSPSPAALRASASPRCAGRGEGTERGARGLNAGREARGPDAYVGDGTVLSYLPSSMGSAVLVSRRRRRTTGVPGIPATAG